MRRVHMSFLAAIMIAVPAAAAFAESPEQHVALLDKACQNGDIEIARAQFTPGCWSREWDSGENFCGQAGRKRFRLAVEGTRTEGDRAVVTVDIRIRDKTVDRVYMYFVRQQGEWLIASIDENRHFGEYFLAGKLDPDFRARNLPASAALDEIGKLMLRASLDTGKVRSEVAAKLSGQELESYLDKIAMLADASFTSSHFEKSLGCGALKFEGGSRLPGRRETLYIILVRQASADKYRLAGYGYGWLGNSSFLGSCKGR